jgi:hypothetical protein
MQLSTDYLINIIIVMYYYVCRFLCSPNTPFNLILALDDNGNIDVTHSFNIHVCYKQNRNVVSAAYLISAGKP